MTPARGPFSLVANLAHLHAPAQRRLWRGLIAAWALTLLGAWGGLSAFTRLAEKACEEAGQTYVTVAPLAAEVMELRDRKGQLEGQPPLLAAERVARGAGIGPERLRIAVSAAPAPAPAAAPAPLPAAMDAGRTISLSAQGLSLRELVDVLRDLRVQAGLNTLSAHLAPSPGDDNRMDLDLVLFR